MEKTESICLACGLCCDGTVLGFVQLTEKETPRIAKIMDLDTENDGGFFLQPCNQFCQKCTIYEDRPTACASFNCGLVHAVESDEVSYAEAVNITEDVKQKKTELEAAITADGIQLKSASFYFKMVELKRFFDNNPSADHPELKSQLNKLNHILTNDFKAPLK